ncbi:MAG: hypothetical protein KC996_09790 [Phycisphaerales bacterium]|nr:hypothetical protein [Phycisphaerales bacterium]
MATKLGAVQGIVIGLAGIGAVVLIGVVGLRFARADAATRVYQDRLRDLSGEYETLRAQYNSAVRQTAVTELVVKDRRVTVHVRTIEGTSETIETACDADKEIYVDFALIDGRLWIRRVFDADTAPSNATVINPKLVDVDWEADGALVGQAVYRMLGEGRWVVRAAGDGALGLARVDDDAVVNLSSPPEIGSFDEVQSAVDEEIEKVGWRDVLSAVIGG